MSAPELVLDALSKTFVTQPRVAALRACSLRVNGGECVAILGASGCGKTTLLRTIAGLEKPDEGRIRFGDRDVTDVPPERRGTGFVFQQDALFPRDTAYENIAFGLRSHGVNGIELDRRVRSIAGRVHAAGVLQRISATLSGGERQRVAIARALAPEPEILLLDEPLSRLDTGLRLALRRELAEVVRSRVATMLYVTHDQSDALALGDRIAVMRHGTIAQIGTARELFERPRDTFVAAAVGTPAIAFVPAHFVFAGAAREERCGLRSGAVRLASSGTVAATVTSIEDFVDVAYAYVESEWGELVVRVDDGVRPQTGDRVRLAIDARQALRFAADGTCVEKTSVPDLQTLAGQTLCVGFTGDSIETAPLREIVELGPCGVVLFARNVTTLEGTRALVSGIFDAFARAGAPEPLVCVDQEGGRVARLRFDEGLPSMLALAATRDASLAHRAGRRLGRALASIGANLDFAPVLDLAVAPGATAFGTRTLGDDPEVVATLGAALVRGLQSAGVAATAKHFPGHGESDLDPHVAFPTRAAIADGDLLPFESAIGAGVRAVMSAHIVVESLGDVPATVAPAVLTALLRDKLGFTGVAFTDCLQMDAIARGMGAPSGAVRALVAGADAAIVSHDLDVALQARDAIVDAVRAGMLSRTRLEEAVARTDALRAELASQRPLREAAAAEPDDGIAQAVARASIVCVRGTAALDADRPIAVVSFEGSTSDGIASTTGERPSLSLALRRRRFRSEYFRVPANVDAAMREMLLEVLGAKRASGERTLIVIARRAHLHAEQRVLLDELLARAPDAIAISALEPFDVPCLAMARNVFATCGDEDASIDALADVLAGRAISTGTLPVRVRV